MRKLQASPVLTYPPPSFLPIHTVSPALLKRPLQNRFRFMPAARNPVMLSVNTHTHRHTLVPLHSGVCVSVCPRLCVCLLTAVLLGDVLITEKLREFVLFTLLSRLSSGLAIVIVFVLVLLLVHCL